MIPLKDHSLLFADIKCTLECTAQNTGPTNKFSRYASTSVNCACFLMGGWWVGKSFYVDIGASV